VKVVVIDNFDSFVYNLAQYLGQAGATPVVIRNDTSVDFIQDQAPDAIVISPGPGRPEQAGCSVDVVTELGPRVPILGVCLGHQAIAVAYGARVVRAGQLVHGKTSAIEHLNSGVFKGLDQSFPATRYHSLVVDPDSIPKALEVTARTERVVMGIRHLEHPFEGVQFHPESVLTEHGLRLIENFLELAKFWGSTPRP